MATPSTTMAATTPSWRATAAPRSMPAAAT
jgi:hypothetical protein